MKILTITCHNVYNHGASLQEYALLKFLEVEGHQVKTIDYRPSYLSNHFKLWLISNPKYERNIFLKILYLTAKLPSRIKALPRKKAFDNFSIKYIKTTANTYRSNEDLKKSLPEADVYICGSDQIWNSFFENGKDPAFYLDFVPDDKLKISYAASFAIDSISLNLKDFVYTRVSRLDRVSVRESSGKAILQGLGIKDVDQVLDPVFLLDKESWERMCASKLNGEYVFVYDCEPDPLIEEFVKKLCRDTNLKIVTVNKQVKYADDNYYLDGPDRFLSLIRNATFVVSNSFHAVAFSLIFERQFTVFNRSEKINTRMRDMVQMMEIPEVLIASKEQLELFDYKINYEKLKPLLAEKIKQSKDFLKSALVRKDEILVNKEMK